MFNFLRKSRTWKNHFDDGVAYGTASDFEKAEKSFRQAIRVAPEQPYPHYELAFTLSLLGRHQEALDELNETNHLLAVSASFKPKPICASSSSPAPSVQKFSPSSA